MTTKRRPHNPNSLFAFLDIGRSRGPARPVTRESLAELMRVAEANSVPVDTPAPICLGCLHYQGQETYQRPTCEAYPEGIPSAILNSQVDHREPHEGDGGTTFSPVDVDAARLVQDRFGVL